jgi:3'(2'), 5'-bisphosphate nucleotidase
VPRSQFESDSRFAAELARGAGELLLDVQSGLTAGELGTSLAKNRGDQASQRYLGERLANERAQDAVLSEEAPDSAARLDSSRVWIIDPLDGTREFSEGRVDWAVHVALWESGNLVVGAVALPGLDMVIDTLSEPPVLQRGERIRLAVSRSRPPELVEFLAERLDAELVPMGSAGFKACAVIRGEADAYVHAGGQFEWDSAAPVVVARHAKLFTSRIDGTELAYNQPNPYLPDLVVCLPEISALVLATIDDFAKENPRD